MTPHAKAEWAATPRNVRGDVHRMHKEFGEAFQRYQADHKTMNTIRQYEQMAQQHGTTLQRALDNYTTMEKKLRADPFGGFDVIAHNLNLRSPDGQKLTFRDLAWAYPQPDPGTAQADAERERPDRAKPPDRAVAPGGEHACARHPGDAV